MNQQATLFPEPPRLPDGFTYRDDFLDPDEERELFRIVEQEVLHPLVFQGFEAKRKVKSYGYHYHFDSRTITEGVPIPEAYRWLLDKVAADAGLPATALKELLVTEYLPGSVINWHRDAPPFERVIGISLLSDCTFRFRPYGADKRTRRSVVSLPVRRRSIYVMDGESRNGWEHSTAPVQATRYSLTIRTLR